MTYLVEFEAEVIVSTDKFVNLFVSCSGVNAVMWYRGQPRLLQSTVQNIAPAAQSYLCLWHQTCKQIFFTRSYSSYKLRSPCH